MPVTGVLLVADASSTITTISSIHDGIARLFPKALGKWTLEYKLFRENPALDLPAKTGPGGSSASSRFMSELYLSHLGDLTFCLIDEPQSNIPGSDNYGKKVMGVFDRGLESIITEKLQSLWVLRQTMRAEGMAYAIDDRFIVRTANVTQTGTFKQILIEIEDLTHDDLDSARSAISDFVAKSGFPRQGRLCFGDTIDIIDGQKQDSKFSISDTGRQYMEAFRLRPNG